MSRNPICFFHQYLLSRKPPRLPTPSLKHGFGGVILVKQKTTCHRGDGGNNLTGKSPPVTGRSSPVGARTTSGLHLNNKVSNIDCQSTERSKKLFNLKSTKYSIIEEKEDYNV